MAELRTDPPAPNRIALVMSGTDFIGSTASGTLRTWLPDDAESAPVPAILECIPHRKRDFMCLR